MSGYWTFTSSTADITVASVSSTAVVAVAPSAPSAPAPPKTGPDAAPPSTPSPPSPPRQSQPGRLPDQPRVTNVIGPTVSLEARPIAVPILSCVFGFPLVALAVICALRYRAKRARKRSRLKRLQAVSDRWRSQEDQLRPSYGVGESQAEVQCVAAAVIAGIGVGGVLAVSHDQISLEPPPPSQTNAAGKALQRNGAGRLLHHSANRGHLRDSDRDSLAEPSLDFEYSDVQDII